MTNRAPSNVILRDVMADDLPIFFAHQLDANANDMAAFTAKDPTDRDAFDAHWAKVLRDDSIIVQTILCDGEVGGHIARHAWFGKPEVTYWIGREEWGKGVATSALAMFLMSVPERPLLARVAKDNIGSLRVLQKCGFVITGEDQGFANARSAVIEEYILTLEADQGDAA